MPDLKQYITAVPDFPQPGILFRDIMPLLRVQLPATVGALEALLSAQEWSRVDAIAGIESRGFILGSALALKLDKGFLPVRKQGKLPPPVSSLTYRLEYGTATLEMQPGSGNVVLLDDVVATSGTMAAAAQLCQRSGFRVEALIALVDLQLVPPLRWNQLTVRTALACG